MRGKVMMLGALVVLGLWGCAKPPTQELEAAKAAVQAARDAEAQVYAPEEIKAAEKALSDAETKVQAKKYDEARTLAVKAKELADQAKELAAKNKEKTRIDAEAALNIAAKAISEVREALDTAVGTLSKVGKVLPGGKAEAFRGEVDSLKSLVDGMDKDLEAARLAFNQGAYKDALNSARGVADRAGALKDDLLALKDRIVKARPLPWYERLKRKRLEELRKQRGS
ncbi:MAG: hypothetical protein DRP95_05250 [Candidatus Latescibacterota bacterium]|nr:MAG: hypothetical protein DRP95_05250 [Candidatus Latescibacterota bacterium]